MVFCACACLCTFMGEGVTNLQAWSKCLSLLYKFICPNNLGLREFFMPGNLYFLFSCPCKALLLLLAYWNCTVPSNQPFENHGSHLKHTTINTPSWEAKWRIMAAKLTRLVSEDNCTVAPSNQKLYYFPFVVLELSSWTFAYAFIC